MNKNNDIFNLTFLKFSFLIKGLLLSIGLIGVLLLKILRPILFIKIGILTNERLGELAARTELYLRKRINNKQSCKEIHIFVSGQPANEQIFKMIKRKIKVLQLNGYCLWVIKKLYSFFGNSKLWVDSNNWQGASVEFNTKYPQLIFTSEEEEQGRQLLEKLGIDFKSQFVCLNVRDSAYLDKVHSYRDREEWAYHDYRDADIDNYISTAEYLAAQGVYTIRMGFMVEKKFDLNSSYIIDYANKHRSDFGDIYLSAKCKFFIGSEGGLITIPWIFNVPVAYSNRIPVTATAGWRCSNIFLPKKLWLSKEKRFLTFSEIHDIGASSWFKSEFYKEAGVEVIENTPEEILGLVKEMNGRLDGTWVTTEEDENLQKCYWNVWPKRLDEYQSSITDISIEFSPMRCQGSLPRISAEFLHLNTQLLDKTTKLKV